MDKLKSILKVIVKATITLALAVIVLKIFLKVFPFFIVTGFLVRIYNEVKFYNYKKQLLNEFQNKYIGQFDYAKTRVEHVQKIDKPNEDVIYADEYVPITENDINNLDNNQINEIYQKRLEIEKILNSTFNPKDREKLKQQLTLLSFQLQDLVAAENAWLNYYKTVENIADNKDYLMNLDKKKLKKLQKEAKLINKNT